MDKNNQKVLQRTVGKFLYYDRFIDLTIMKALKSLAAVQTNPTIKNAIQRNLFLNHNTTYPDAVTEYIRSGIIIRMYSDVSYISEP